MRGVRRTIIVALASLAACGDGDPPEPTPRATTDLDRAWSAFATCLVGRPLDDGERASARVRAIDLGTLQARPVNEPAKGVAWPQRCGALLSELGTASPEVEAHALRGAAQRIVTLGYSNALVARPSPGKPSLVDELFDAATEAHVRHVVAPDIEQPPAPAAAPVTLAPFADRAFDRLTRAPTPDARFHLGEPASLLCTAASTDALTCERSTSPLDRELPRALEEKGRKLAAPVGTATNTQLVPIDVPSDGAAGLVFGDVALAWRATSDVKSLDVSATRVDGVAVGPTVGLGRLRGPDLWAARRSEPGCDALFVLAGELQPRDYFGAPPERSHQVAATLRGADGAWSPLAIMAREGSANVGRLDGHGSLSCADGRVTLELGAGSRLGRVSCTREACKEEFSGALPSRLAQGSLRLRLGDLSLVVATSTASTPLFESVSIVELRLASLKDLATAPSKLLAVSSSHGGPSARYRAPEGFVRDGRAYVFFTGDGTASTTFAVTVDASGAVRPLTRAAQ